MTSPQPEAVPGIEASCLAMLRARHATLATAESLTAGLVSASLASVPGASDVLRGGLTAYASDVKISVLGVEPAVVARHGVVSAECAEAMALRALDLFGATWAVSTTGVAGPDRQEGRPVGTVFVAVAGPAVTDVRHWLIEGSRNEIRRQAVSAALNLLAARCA